MKTDPITIGLIIAAAVCIILFLVWKNRKDEKKFEKDTIQSEIKPERSDEDKEVGV